MARSLHRRVGVFGRALLALLLVVAGLAAVLAPLVQSTAAQEEHVQANATIRVVHASPGTPEIDVLVDGQPLVEGLAYGSVTDSVPLPAEEHQLQVVPTGQTADAAVIDQDLNAEAGKAYIFVAMGPLNEIQGKLFDVNLDAIEQGKARARVINASADAGEVDVAVTGGDALFDGVGFTDATDYEEIDPGGYSLDVRGEEDRVLATVPDLTVEAGRVYDIVAIGQVSDQSLNLLSLETSVSRPCSEVLGLGGGAEDACVRIVHAAAGAEDVDTYVGESLLVEGLAFGAATEYVNLPAGDDRPVQVTAAGASVEEAILDTDIDLNAGQAYQIVATGEQDEIEATVNEIDLSPLPENQARLRVVHASPDAGAVDVGVAEGSTLFEDVDFRDATNYAVVDADAYTVEVHPAGEDTVALQTDVELEAGTVYDAIVIGRADDQTLALLVLTSEAGVREGGLATPGADVMTTPGAVGTAVMAATPLPAGETEDLAETAEAVETPTS